MAKKLSARILEKLVEKTGNGEAGIRVQLSHIRRQHPAITLNAAAQVFAARRNFNVMGMLDDEDRTSMPTASQIPAVSPAAITPRTAKSSSKAKPIVVVLNYATPDSFGKKHIEEANKAYNAGCYTAAFILCRKIFENLIINEVLLKQFPEKNKANRELYYNEAQSRFKDFSEVVDNLHKKRMVFPVTCRKPIESLRSKLGVFMGNANDYTHSWYHICTRDEFGHADVQQIADLIATIAAGIAQNATPSRKQ